MSDKFLLTLVDLQPELVEIFIEQEAQSMLQKVRINSFFIIKNIKVIACKDNKFNQSN